MSFPLLFALYLIWFHTSIEPNIFTVQIWIVNYFYSRIYTMNFSLPIFRPWGSPLFYLFPQRAPLRACLWWMVYPKASYCLTIYIRAFILIAVIFCITCCTCNSLTPHTFTATWYSVHNQSPFLPMGSPFPYPSCLCLSYSESSNPLNPSACPFPV